MATATKPQWAKRPDATRKNTAAVASEDPIDALIREQAERANPDAQTLPAPAVKASVKHISLNMNGALHKRLKHYCVVHERNVSELLSDLAERFLSTQVD